MNDDGFGLVLLTCVGLFALLIATARTEFNPSEIRECRAKQEWCKVQKPRLHEALYGETK